MAIAATELRIGNLVYEKHCDDSLHIGVVALIQKYGDATKIRTENRWYAEEPIPLTEEWLVRFGFAIKNGITHLYILKYAEDKIIEVCIDGGVRLWNGNDNWQQNYDRLWCNLKYVHQLQNLYKELTGEELQLKE